MLRNSIVVVIFVVLFNALVKANSNSELNCGRLNTEYNENNKHTTELDEFPWMAGIRYSNEGIADDDKIELYCSAVLISDRHLLTIADCLVNDDTKKPTSVILGDENSYEILETTVNPNFSRSSYENVIAIITLEKAVEFSDYIQPVCWLSSDTLGVSSSEYEDKQLINAGWTRELQKQKEVIQFVRRYDCSNFYREIFLSGHIYTESVICGGCVDNANLLAGAALMSTFTSKFGSQHYYLIGLLSGGLIGKCDMKNPLIFEKVDYHQNWIQYNIN